MNETPNRYPGICHDCAAPVAAQAGTIERGPGRRAWTLRCRTCTDSIAKELHDCMGVDTAYEDACARACGL
ncbi:MAG: hypothetical protein K8T26_12360 [Lentisphaerae bacterium]|nr:hypothetical protein [Lentisphaerota bacterium]